MTEKQATAEVAESKAWTDAEKTAQYTRARELVDHWCKGRPAEWREEVTHDAYERWFKESQGAPVDRWVRWAIADASKKSKAEPVQEGSGSPWAAASTSEDESLSTVFSTLDEAKRATIDLCEREFSDLVEIAWDELPGWAKNYLHAKVHGDADAVTEVRARHALEKLRDAVLEVRAIVELPKKGGVRANFLRVIERQMRGEDWNAVAEAEPRNPDLDIDEASMGNLRQRVAYHWPIVRECLRRGEEFDRVAFEAHLAEGGKVIRDFKASLAPREIAVVAILMGAWPEMDVGPDGVAPKDIISSVVHGFGSKLGAMPKAERVVGAAIRYQASRGEKKK